MCIRDRYWRGSDPSVTEKIQEYKKEKNIKGHKIQQKYNKIIRNNQTEVY